MRAAADVAAVVYVHRGRFRRRHLLAEARRHFILLLRGSRGAPSASRQTWDLSVDDAELAALTERATGCPNDPISFEKAG